MVLTFDEYDVCDAAERCREDPDYRSIPDARPKGILASVPGGAAYKEVMDIVKSMAPDGVRGHGDPKKQAATVWFGEEVVYGQEGPEGWVHPFGPCGRHNVPVPARPRDAMWDEELKGAGGRIDEAVVGKTYNCWCCKWLEVTDQWHQAGFQLYCLTSNIYEEEWLEKYNAGCSELPEEVFQNEKPEGWGSGELRLQGSEAAPLDKPLQFIREAPIHPHTQKPLGFGCRWERQCMDAKPYEVRCFFYP